MPQNMMRLPSGWIASEAVVLCTAVNDGGLLVQYRVAERLAVESSAP
jgi:hypothetical protein